MGFLDSLAVGLRGAGSVLNPEVQRQVSNEYLQRQNIDENRKNFVAQQVIKGIETGAIPEEEGRAVLERIGLNVPVGVSPDVQAKRDAVEREKAFRSEVSSLGEKPDYEKLAVVAAKYGKPELSVQLYNAIETREAQKQARIDALELKKAQFDKEYELKRERAQTDKERLELDRWYKQSSIGIQAMLADLKKNNQGGERGIDQDRRFRGEDRMKNDFEQVTKSAREELDSAKKIASLTVTPNQKMNAQQQQALIFMFGKVLDPNSVLREGEYDRIAKARGYYDSATMLYDKVMSGQLLTKDQIANIKDMSAFLSKAAEDKIKAHSATYEKIAKDRGYDPEAIITNPSWRSGGKAQEAPKTEYVEVRKTKDGRTLGKKADGTIEEIK